ncbi:MAG: amidohydrolase family protein [Chloroflexota bacterium]|nr:amidohydrolase family protein [Chloroflexota bacterium]
MMIVDSHCHAALGWYEPVEVLLRQMDANGVERAILIQIGGQFDNSYQTECVRRYPDRLASVVCVDPARSDAPGALERLAAEGATGVRLRPGDRSPGDDPLALWRKAAELGLSISSGGSGLEFADDAFAGVFEAFPELPIVIEHLGSVNNPREEAPERRPAEKVFGLARYPNAYMKIHGLGEFATRAMPVRGPFPFVEPIPPLLERAYDAFGPTRLMWGSDFPPVSGREGYANALKFPLERFANKPEAERAQIFGEVAWSIFGTRR